METISFPIRINKYLAHKGIATRRSADTLIKNGEVFINGQTAQLGDMVLENDTVTLKTTNTERIYLAYYKPKGVVTHSPQYEDEKDIAQTFGRDDVFPIGRLDKQSEGLILLTNDGRITQKLLNPKSDQEKEYIVKVDKQLKKEVCKKFSAGIDIEGYTTKPAKAKILGDYTISIILTEGKRHQIRRMLAALGYTVLSLKRVRVGTISLKKLKPNEYREIKNNELSLFFKSIGFDSPN